MTSTSHEDQYAPEPTPQEEEAWRELEARVERAQRSIIKIDDDSYYINKVEGGESLENPETFTEKDFAEADAEHDVDDVGYGYEPTTAEEEAWREMDKRQNSRSDASSGPPANEIALPTNDMIAAGVKASLRGNPSAPMYVLEIWNAMCAAAPVAQEPVGTVYWRGSPYTSPSVDWRGRPPEDGAPIYTAPVASQAQPTVKDSLTTEQPVSGADGLPPVPKVQVPRVDAVERLIEAVRNYMSFGCPVCSGDCFSANPPVSGCLAREAQEAIDHTRHIEEEEK